MLKKDYLIITITFLLCLFLFYIHQEKLDFWLHLKNGEIIWETKKIPTKDTFSFGETKRNVLNQQWLTEVIFYLLHKNLGEYSLLIFKSLLGTATAFILYKTMMSQTNNILSSSFFIIFFTTLVMRFYNLRPRMFTIFFFALTLYIYHIFKNKNEKVIYIIPVLFIIWIMFHGGYVVGFGILAVITIIEIIKNIIPKFMNFSENKLSRKKIIIMLITILTVGITILFRGLPISFEKEEGKKLLSTWIIEWMPIDTKMSYNYLFLFYIIFGTIIILLVIKKVDLLDLGIWFVAISLPFFALRHIDIVSVATIPIINKYLIILGNNLENKKHKGEKNKKKKSDLDIYSELVYIIKESNYIKFCIWILAVQILIIYIFLVPYRFALTKNIFNEKKFVRTYLPLDGIDFVKKNKPKGRMFNDFNWGGLFIWYLYPEYKVAIDARYSAAYKSSYISRYMHTLFALGEQDEFLDKMKIKWVIIRKDRPLSDYLSRRKDWELIYKDNICMIYVRKK